MRNLYDILGVSKNASPEDIKKAFRKLAIQHHPDKFKHDDLKKVQDNEELFKEIGEAYTVLSDTDKRAHYDQFGTIDDGVNQPPMNGVDLNDLMANFFGGGGFHGFGGGGGGGSFSFVFGEGPRHHAHHTQTHVRPDGLEVQLDICEIFTGTKKKIQYESPEKCDACQGTGAQDPSHILKCMSCQGIGNIHRQIGPFTVQSSMCPSCMGQGTSVQHNKQCMKCKGSKVNFIGKRFDIDIPKGLPNMHTVTLPGKGAYNVALKRNHDLRLVFKHKIQEPYRLDPDHTVHYHLKVTLEELLTGFEKTIHIYNKEYVISSEHVFNPTRTLVMNGLGLYDMKAETQRDLHIHFDIQYTDGSKLKKYAGVLRKMLKIPDAIESAAKDTQTIRINDHMP